MFSGHNYIGFEKSVKGKEKLQAFSTVKGDYLSESFTVATQEDMEAATAKAAKAFPIFKKTTFEQRALFLENIAEEIQALGDGLIQRAMLESGLTEARLVGERGRTMNQLRLFAEVLREGSWVEAVIDTALPDRKPLPRVDLRKMLLPIGPVVVFAASNFPFAFSTAGGDTASALAAGCPVIVKAHSSHLGTNELVANAIIKAAQASGMPDGVFSSLVGGGSTIGQALAKHPVIKAVGFTGSFKAGMALFKTANERDTPIPVYAEMSSINPILILPRKLAEGIQRTASMVASSITLGVGQFCTNPGLLFMLKNRDTEKFIAHLVQALQEIPASTMLNETICKSYYSGMEKLIKEKGVTQLLDGKDGSDSYKASASLLQVSAKDFMANAALQDEVFGPSSLIILCDDAAQLLKAVTALHGQLTGTVIGNEEDTETFSEHINVLTEKVGRLVYNGVPTGVEVSYAMVHGGPFPATTDARNTSVGADAIKRFVRPVCFQDCPQQSLPQSLKNENPAGIMRKVNGKMTTDSIK